MLQQLGEELHNLHLGEYFQGRQTTKDLSFVKASCSVLSLEEDALSVLASQLQSTVQTWQLHPKRRIMENT